MAKIWVRNTKTGMERTMTQTSFDYLSSKKRGFEFLRKEIEPGSIEEHKERLKAEKEAAANKAGEQSQETPQQESKTTKKVPKVKNV